MNPQANRFGAFAGVGTTVLVIAAFATSSQPPSVSAGGAPVVKFYTSHSTAQHTSDMLWVLGFAVFVFFAGWLRGLLREEPRAEALATTALAGGAIAATGASVYFGLDFTLASMPASIAPAAAQAVNLLALQLFLPVAIGVLIFGIAAGAAILRSQVLPAWMGWTGLVVAITAPAGPFALVALAIWAGVIGVMASRRVRSRSQDLPIASPPARGWAT
jgi:hypothetical protein